jgi:hypothetical protein
MFQEDCPPSKWLNVPAQTIEGITVHYSLTSTGYNSSFTKTPAW